MRGFAIALSLPTLLLGVSCAGGGAPSIPMEPSAELPRTIHGEVTAGGIAVRGDVTTSAAALFQLTLDPMTGATSVESATPRSVQETDDLFLLSLEQFFGPQHLQVDGVSWTAETVDIAYRVLHPFPAPTDPTAPASATNRADLGFAGMLLLLADVPSVDGNQFFNTSPEERIVADTALVTNADAYYRPAGLLDLPGFTANTFPYKLVVDETLDPRTSQASGAAITNGGNPRGNHSDNLDWRRATLGPTNDGWTGYGVLHQGQAARNTLSLNRIALADGPVTIDLALIARYVDPRGGATPAEKRANRLPPGGPDYHRFVYREPHGALDVQRLIFREANGGLIAGQPSAAATTFHVEDWDARAIESTLANLAEEPIASRVAIGEAGVPALAVSIPGVLDIGDGSGIVNWDTGLEILDDDAFYGGDVAADSGRPGDALCYRHDIQKSDIDSGNEGLYVGLLRAVDPEALLLDPSFVLELDSTLAPLASDIPLPQTYQRFAIPMAGANQPPTVTVDPPATVLSGRLLQLTVSAYDDPDGDMVYVGFDWNTDGDLDDEGENGVQITEVPQLFTSPFTYNNADLIEDPWLIGVHAQDEHALKRVSEVAFTLGPNRAPEVTGSPVLEQSVLPPPASFTLLESDAIATDPEGDPVSFSVTNDTNADVLNFDSFPTPANSTAMTTPGEVQFVVRACDFLHEGELGSPFSSIVGERSHDCPCGWMKQFGGSGQDSPTGMAVDPEGDILLTGFHQEGIDFGAGELNTSGAYIVKLDSDGGHLWYQAYDSLTPWALALDPGGNIYLACSGGGPAWGGGSGGPGETDIVLAKFDGAGTYLDHHLIDGTHLTNFPFDVSVGPAGNVALCGIFQNALDFGGGLRPRGGFVSSGFLLGLDSSLDYLYDVPLNPESSTYNVGWRCVFDDAGDAYYTGHFSRGTDFGAGPVLIPPACFGGMVVKLAPEGELRWERHWVDSEGFATGRGITLSGVNQEPVILANANGSVDFGGGPRVMQGDGVAVVRFSPDGDWESDVVIDGSGFEDGIGVAGSPSGDIVVSLSSGPTAIDLGGGTRSTTVPTEFIVKLDQGGEYLWDAHWNRYIEDADDLYSRLAVFPQGDVLISGRLKSVTVDYDPGPGECWATSASPDIYLSKLLGDTGRW